MNEVVTEGLERVVEELRRRGLAAGEQEANARIAQAEAEAEDCRAAARAEAERIVSDAREDARRRRAQLDHELRRATDAGVMAFTRAVQTAVLVPAVDGAVDAALNEPRVLGDLLVEAVRAYGSSPGTTEPLEVQLPAGTPETLEAALLARTQEVARRGVRVRMDGGVEGGFVLRDGRTQLDFSPAAFREVLLGFLAPRVRDRLRQAEGAAR